MSEPFSKVRFVASAPSPKEFKGQMLPGILVVGRSNVGKSTLINGILNAKLAFSSKKAGKTKALNYFLVDDSFYLIDSPGYGSTGFATMSTVQFSTLMEESLPSPSIRGIVLLLDLRREPSEEDKAFYSYLQSFHKPILVVLTKTDQMNQSALAKARKTALDLGFDRAIESELKLKNRAFLRKAILSLLKR